MLDRQFEVAQPDTVYVSAVTEFAVAGSKLYLSPVMALFDRSILGFAFSISPASAFTAQSLEMALGDRQFDMKLLVHTDQGIHYQHSSWRKMPAEHGAVQSISRKGNCYDNAFRENFFGQLKTEAFYGERFESVDELTVVLEAELGSQLYSLTIGQTVPGRDPLLGLRLKLNGGHFLIGSSFTA